MIPTIAIIRIRSGQERGFSLWIPLFLVWLLVLPFVIVLAPFVVLACLVTRTRLALFAALWEMLCSLGGTRIEVRGPKDFVYVRFI